MGKKIQIVTPMWPSPRDVHIGIFVANVARALQELGFTVELAAAIHGKARSPLEKIRAHAGLALGIASSSGSDADCVYLHAPSWFGPLVHLARLPLAKKLVVHMHGGEVFPHSQVERWSAPLVSWMAHRADLVISPSRYYARELARAFALDEQSMFISPSGGVDTVTFAPRDRTAARRALDLPLDRPVLGFVGRIVADKGWDTFLKTVAGTAALGVVAGDGEELEQMKSLARELGVSDRVRFLGLRPQADLPQIYASLDAFLFPTRRKAECLGLVPLEAMACGVPVIGSNGYAVPEYVADGRTGFLCPETDPSAFAAAVARLLALPEEERRSLAERARSAASAFDTRASTERLASRIEQMLAVTEQTG